jgi:hypothetical protein
MVCSGACDVVFRNVLMALQTRTAVAERDPQQQFALRVKHMYVQWAAITPPATAGKGQSVAGSHSLCGSSDLFLFVLCVLYDQVLV